MQRRHYFFILLMVVVGISVFPLFSVESVSAQIKANGSYVGSSKCSQCHEAIYDQFVTSGHPYKLKKPEDAKAAGIPLPSGYTWKDISYVIGGRNWKIRYMDKKGYIITMTGPNREVPGKNQYNMEWVVAGKWTNYHAGEKNKKYNCGRCHTTGYSKEGHQDGLEGIVGTWAFSGIQCEGCHGSAKNHVESGGDPELIKITREAILCGSCHIRGAKEKIPAKGGFIRHNGQYNELLASPHKNLKCVACHNPHLTAQRGIGIKVACNRCHRKQTKEYEGSRHSLRRVKCENCHMPLASKTAVAFGKYEADIKSHLYKINMDPDAQMFTEDGKFANGYLTVEYACLYCHPAETKQWALKYAKVIHTIGKK
jgi:hypothetical protein